MFTSEYPIINVTVDVVAVRTLFENERADVLVIRRKEDPYAGALALPGGFLNIDETAEQGALRELREETGVTGPFIRSMAPLPVRTEPGRDPRGPTISLPYVITVPASTEPVAGDDASEAFWMPLTEAAHNEWAFDHGKILATAVEWKYGALVYGNRRRGGW